LTVRPEGHICHYKILEKDGKFRLAESGEACNSVSELVNFYKSKPIEGLCPSTVLKFYPSRANKFSLEGMVQNDCIDSILHSLVCSLILVDHTKFVNIIASDFNFFSFFGVCMKLVTD
jgi:hypothetical protein